MQVPAWEHAPGPPSSHCCRPLDAHPPRLMLTTPRQPFFFTCCATQFMPAAGWQRNEPLGNYRAPQLRRCSSPISTPWHPPALHTCDDVGVGTGAVVAHGLDGVDGGL